MAKYDPLHRYLRRQSAPEVVLTFSEIENMLTALLPKSARRREWWANETSAATTHVQRHAWMKAGYRAFPTIETERVTFRRG
ncbi:hypothetical protein [Brevundimonas sp.]|uniref:DUF7662 domain-containing protein n=1 Tax=Brevundimonas sp. TaxID=1871086 RepID=UPI0028AD5D9A|nr:hypothetical protein [Brevundimonas sp.]